MQIEITKADVAEIDRKLPDLAAWLTENFSSFNACAIILSAVCDKVEEYDCHVADPETELSELQPKNTAGHYTV